MKWDKKPLEAIADFRLGKMLDEKKNRGDLLPYLANVNVRWGGFDLDDLREMRFEQHELDKYGLQHGDIVMCEGGEPGRCAIWKDQAPCMMIQKALHRIRPHECLNTDFLYYLFLHKGRAGHLSPLFTGATIKHLPREKLALVEIEVPPLLHQKRIADILSSYDDLLTNNARRIRLLEDAARLLYEEWFVRLRFPGHEHTPIHNGLPKGWQKKPLEEIAPLNYGKALKQEDREPGPCPVYGSSGIVGMHSRALVDGPSIIVGRKGNVGSVHLALSGFWPIDTVYYVDTEHFGYYLLHNLRYQNFISSDAAVPGLNRTFAHSLPVLVPPLTLQSQFEDFAAVIYRQISMLTQQNQKLEQARDLLLPRLMSGEIAV